MTKTEIINSKYNLLNCENYNNFLIYNLKEIIDNYIHILLNYILLFNQKINMNNNNIKYFILKKGINTINNIFLFILYHTKNLEMTFYHSQNSYIFYIEFIEQLNFTPSNDTIKITINDAITFVYKKNIYYMNNLNNNNATEQEKYTFEQIEELLKIYLLIIDIFNFNLIELTNIINNFQLNISLKNKNMMNIIYHFLNMLFLLDIEISQKKIILFLFIDEINSKKNINYTLLKNKIKSFEYEIDNYNPHSIVNLLFN